MPRLGSNPHPPGYQVSVTMPPKQVLYYSILLHFTSQVGRKTRNEKIRTYNYPQDRITDHRIQRTVYNVAEFMSGGAMLHELISDIRQHDYQFRIDQLLS
jgi:Protein chain release factor A